MFCLEWSAPPARAASACEAALVPLRPPRHLPVEGPQGITIDLSDGSLWVSSILSNTVLHLDQDLEVLGSFEAPFAQVSSAGASGIAYNPRSDTLFLCQPALQEIWEVEKDGTQVGVIPLNLPPPVNIIAEAYPKGLAFNPLGDAGRGSLWVVEAVMTAIYEVSLAGDILDSFCHPDDGDGCPGKGLATFSGDIELYWQGGEPVAIELLGGASRGGEVHRLTLGGEVTGLSYPLAECGGRPAGFARGEARDAASGEPHAVLFVTVESSAELYAFLVVEPEILPVLELSCDTEAAGPGSSATRLSWRDMQPYDRIEVLREGELLQTLDGSAQSFVDAAPPDGILRYEVVARAGACETRASCTLVTGAGQVLATRIFDGKLPVDIAEDGDGFLWVTDAQENQVVIYDKELELIASFPSPFQADEDATAAIAYNPVNDTLFVYNAETNEIAEIDTAAQLVTPAFPSGVPSDPDDEATVPAMLFDPAGDGGAGSFWFLDYTTASIQERGLTGVLLRSCVHPDHLAEPPPEKSILDAYAWGMSAVPGHGFELLEVGGGKVRDRRSTRFLQLETSTCAANGSEIPLDGVAAAGNAVVFGLHLTAHDGRPVAYVLSTSSSVPLIHEVEVRPPPLPHLTELSCAQESEARNVTLTFRTQGEPESVLIDRDGAPLATLAGSATRFEDLNVPQGFHTYELRSRKGALESDDRRCSLRVGPGSIAARSFSLPVSAIHQVAYDPAEDVYIAASLSNRFSDSLYRYSRDLEYQGEIPSPFPQPHQVAALAVRAVQAGAGVESEIYCLGWLPGALPGSQNELPVRAINAAGQSLREFIVRLPRPPGTYVTFPSGMAWDSSTDTLWYLERNSATITNVSLAGSVLSSFSHPAPPHQDGVFNYGLAVAGERNVLYLSSAGRYDYDVTKIVEVSRSGKPTGVEIPAGPPTYDKVRGFALDPEGFSLVASATAVDVPDLVRFRAFDPVAAARDLACSPAGTGVRLQWVNGEAYDAIAIYRNGLELATLSGAETSWLDLAPPPAVSLYRVVGRRGELAGAGAACESAPDREFLRGDIEENGELNITDAVAILAFLFIGATPPACPDAADVNDTGDVNITDPLVLLNFLFLSGPPPAMPFPDEGLDPTAEDSLACPASG